MPEAVLIQNGSILRRLSFDAPQRISDLADCIPQPCGGKGYCGKCRVQVRGSVSRFTRAEYNHLTAQERAQGFRLSCQAMATGNVRITLPQSFAIQKSVPLTVGALDPMGKEYGFVLDLGTTTIYAALYRLSSGKLCGQKSIANPQSFDGADVLSRIAASLQGDAGRLSASVQHALFDLCTALLIENKLAPNDVDAAVLVGNTAMLYLLFGLNPASIAAAPFHSETLFGGFYPAGFLPIRPGTQLYIPPCISAFLGADTTAAVLGSHLQRNEQAILADLGTNAEMVLFSDGRFYGCSCAAGPAFEGVGLTCGMPAVDGAVYAVQLTNGYFICQTIADAPPKGFCGSGLLDMIACMVRSGALHKDGKITDSDRFYLSDTPLYLTQEDIRAVQLAKSAVRTGLEVLLARTNNVQSLLLAGSFGSHLHPASASRIGLIPPSLRVKTNACGNAAATGAAMLLFNRANILKAEQIASATETIQLADLPDFQDMLCRYTAFE